MYLYKKFPSVYYFDTSRWARTSRKGSFIAGQPWKTLVLGFEGPLGHESLYLTLL